MKYRAHKGGLAESLAMTIEVNSLDDVAKHFKDTCLFDDVDITDLKCEYYGYDKRIDWDTWIITAAFCNGVPERFVLGYSDGELK